MTCSLVARLRTGDGLTIRELCNRYLSVKESQVNNREITRRHFENLYAACELVVVQFGNTRLVDDLVSEDFEAFRMSLAKTRGAWALGSVIQKIRSLFKYGFDAGLIDKPVRYGPAFRRPGMAAIRRERMEKGQGRLRQWKSAHFWKSLACKSKR